MSEDLLSLGGADECTIWFLISHDSMWPLEMKTQTFYLRKIFTMTVPWDSLSPLLATHLYMPAWSMLAL